MEQRSGLLWTPLQESAGHSLHDKDDGQMCSALARAAERVQHLRQQYLEGLDRLASYQLVQGLTQVVISVEAVAACE
eukprot:5417240-Pyramimonas_sp.AAC.1